MINYGFTKELKMTLDNALEITTEELKKEVLGFLPELTCITSN
jgi:hypothetical protein